MRRLRDLQASGRLSEWWTLLKHFTLHSFLLWVFTIRFSHTKFSHTKFLTSSVHGGGSWSSTHASCGSSSVRRQATHPSSRVLTAAARSPSTSSSATGRGGGGIRRTSSVHGRRLLAAVELGGVDWILETCPR
jgi:hypothetical protein